MPVGRVGLEATTHGFRVHGTGPPLTGPAAPEPVRCGREVVLRPCTSRRARGVVKRSTAPAAQKVGVPTRTVTEPCGVACDGPVTPPHESQEHHLYAPGTRRVAGRRGPGR